MNSPDQPWKIARMNKFTYALALGAGLVLSLAGPSVHAAPIVQQLATPTMTAAEFNSLFQPIPGAAPIMSSYQFMNTPTTGMVESQVFQGTGAATGLYAYAYQIAVNNVSDTNGQPTSVNSATLAFNATPTPASFTTGGTPSSVYVVTDGQVGGINLPQAAPGSVIQTPTSVAWMPGSKTGALTFQYLDADPEHRPAAGGLQQRDHRRAHQPAVHDPAGEPPERQSADHLSHGLLGPGGYDPGGPRSRARDRAGMGRDDRGRGPGPACPQEPPGGLSRLGSSEPGRSATHLGIGPAVSWPDQSEQSTGPRRPHLRSPGALVLRRKDGIVVVRRCHQS